MLLRTLVLQDVALVAAVSRTQDLIILRSKMMFMQLKNCWQLNPVYALLTTQGACGGGCACGGGGCGGGKIIFLFEIMTSCFLSMYI